MSNDPNVGGFGVPGQYYAGYTAEDVKKMQQNIGSIGGKLKQNAKSPVLMHTQNIKNQALNLLADIHSNKNLDEESRKLLLQHFNTGGGTDTYGGLEQRLGTISNEYRSALEGTDPKFKARVATQKYYETMFDQPGSRQTRGADFSLLMSNATKR